MNEGGANRSLKVVARKTIAGPGQMERGKPRARSHRRANYRAGLKCMDVGWVPALRVHCRASRTGRMEGGRFEEDDLAGRRAIPDRSPNREGVLTACGAATLQPRPMSCRHS